MTYNHNFVACIKVDGKVLREFKDEVYLPFGSEYTIFLKNMNSQRAVVSISIDGKDLGRRIVVPENDEVEIERFIGDNMNKGYKFKFIEKTKQISEHRGDKAEDGIIRLSYQFEKKNPIVVTKNTIVEHHHHYHEHYPRWDVSNPSMFFTSNGTSNDASNANQLYSCNIRNRSIDPIQNQCEELCLFSNVDVPINEDGITVEGNDSNQSFENVFVRELENEEYIICFKLKGGTKEHKQEKPVLVNQKVTCKHCGKRSSSSNKFCPGCSARLL